MSLFQLNDLTEEIFGHLCNVALTKCSDKSEKKRAGCGGRAMRKRVLIKNFVSDLFKMPKKASSTASSTTSSSSSSSSSSSDESMSNRMLSPTSSDDDEFEDYEMTDVSFYDDEIESYDGGSNISYHQRQQIDRQIGEDCWLSQADLYQTEGYYTEPQYGFESSSIHNTMQYGIYDVYSNVSEQALEGGLPAPNDPLASISSIMHPTESTGYEMYSSSTSIDTNDENQFFPTSDDYFLSSSTDHFEPMEETHELTDLDASTGEIQLNKNKRRSTELFDDFNVAFQKRIKI